MKRRNFFATLAGLFTFRKATPKPPIAAGHVKTDVSQITVRMNKGWKMSWSGLSGPRVVKIHSSPTDVVMKDDVFAVVINKPADVMLEARKEKKNV